MNDRDRSLEMANHEGEVRRALTSMVDDPTAERMASTFEALADPTRVRIISVLADTELCVSDLAACLGMSVSAVSHQLRLLREKRLVRARRAGRYVFYALDDEHIRGLFEQGLEHVRHE